MLAAIDIGTNSVLLLIAKTHGATLDAVCQEARITRLGEGLSHTTILSSAAIDRTMAALREYRDLCRVRGIADIAAVGTAAMRTARNAHDLIERARSELDIAIDVISGNEEARLTWKASAASFGDDAVVMDIGGGSTEFIAPRQRGEQGLETISIPVGVVGLTERFLSSDPPSPHDIAEARCHLREMLEQRLDRTVFAQPDSPFVVAAGTPTTLAAMHARIDPYDPTRVHGMTLSTDDVATLIDKIAQCTMDERRAIKGMQRGREDVILAGALLMREAMDIVGQARAIVSDRGVRWGVLIELASRMRGVTP